MHQVHCVGITPDGDLGRLRRPALGLRPGVIAACSVQPIVATQHMLDAGVSVAAQLKLVDLLTGMAKGEEHQRYGRCPGKKRFG